LALLHKDPAHPWTISDLARGVGLARTRLSERFRRFLGESPMAYLGQWRLKLAADILQSSDDSIAQVASAVGYASEASFNRAFKREYACPPAQFRRSRKAAPSNSWLCAQMREGEAQGIYDIGYAFNLRRSSCPAGNPERRNIQ